MRGSGGGVGALRVDPEAPWDGMSHANSLWERREVGGGGGSDDPIFKQRNRVVSDSPKAQKIVQNVVGTTH